MLPVVDMVVQRFIDGPNATYPTGNSTFVPPRLMAAFSNDGQINQIVAALGVFDDQAPLPSNRTLPDRKFRASRLVPMRGTVAFERLSCPESSADTTYNSVRGDVAAHAYMRIRLNDVVYPVVECSHGPGSSCPLAEYQAIIKGKLSEAGNFTELCSVMDAGFSSKPTANFFMDNTLSYAAVIKP